MVYLREPTSKLLFIASTVFCTLPLSLQQLHTYPFSPKLLPIRTTILFDSSLVPFLFSYFPVTTDLVLLRMPPNGFCKYLQRQPLSASWHCPLTPHYLLWKAPYSIDERFRRHKSSSKSSSAQRKAQQKAPRVVEGTTWPTNGRVRVTATDDERYIWTAIGSAEDMIGRVNQNLEAYYEVIRQHEAIPKPLEKDRLREIIHALVSHAFRYKPSGAALKSISPGTWNLI